jgi:photosystem II stability/assembly factor-like uncharacterized protein
MRHLSVLGIAACILVTGCGSPGATSTTPTSTPGSGTSSSPTAPGGLNHVHSIVVLPNDPNELYLGTHYHLYKSTDGGTHWHTLAKQMVLSMAMDPAHPATLYAVSSQRGLERSSDGGTHWSPSAKGIPAHAIIGVAFDPVAHAVFAYGLGIYRSMDGGVHWKSVVPPISISNISTSNDGTSYAASSTGLYVSHDGGSHWKSVKSIGNQPILQVGAAGSVAYAVAPISILKSANDGKSWKTLPKSPAGIEFIGVSPSDPNEVVAELGGKGFEASHDGGATWQKANNGIHYFDFNASSVRVAPSSPQVVYTGAWGLHFYVSHDGGSHWKQVALLTH